MPDAYFQLLDATIQQLEELKARGTRFVSVSPQMLETLARQQEGRKNFKLQTPNSKETSISNVEKGTGQQETGTATEPVAKEAAFADLQRRAMACVKCSHLASSRKNVVFGVGNRPVANENHRDDGAEA